MLFHAGPIRLVFPIPAIRDTDGSAKSSAFVLKVVVCFPDNVPTSTISLLLRFTADIAGWVDHPTGFAGPVGPVTDGPVGPVAPVSPLMPDGPVGPVTVDGAPVGPVHPVGPVGPVTVEA